MEICLVAAVSKNNCIGKGGGLPWNFPKDLAYFKKITWGQWVIMGRKTWESIPKGVRPLPGRKNVILTSESPSCFPSDVLVFSSIDSALNALQELTVERLMVIGGESLFAWALDRAKYLYLTRIEKDFHGDRFFPKINFNRYQLIQSHSSMEFNTKLFFEVYKKYQAS
jgi:dihydrofolate reductase